MNRIIYINLLFILALSACDSRPSFSTLCAENPEICQEFTKDTWCKRERIEVAYANWEHKENPHDLEKFNQLIAYEKYEKCIAKASLIEHIKLKEKQTRRLNNLAITKEKIKRISEITKHSEHPRLLYYHWSRYLDKNALAKFLALEHTELLKTHESQFELATYYTKRDPIKTLGLLYHSLELVKPKQQINVEVFKAIATYFADKQEAKQTYIWLKVLRLYAPEDEDIKQETLDNYIKGYQLDDAFLNKIASATLNKIQAGEFKAPKY
ncbi:DUF2989 domain-containing protein [Thalassotalea profundi]|uniref:DUF2989 domain-containing protein n=1 Tax=Thalassotalea profundi TaxID=2036687 RepID=A0ABQ3ILT4_9GAMM|nr:DUF2989 domain-containing protein [Thalassotalea profundi]GHE83202.1 hypothetical protein GCM10011501_09500 [Thalassotalea profundi]